MSSRSDELESFRFSETCAACTHYYDWEGPIPGELVDDAWRCLVCGGWVIQCAECALQTFRDDPTDLSGL